MTVCACGQPLWHPESIERGYCKFCRQLGDYRDFIGGLRAFPYELPDGYISPWCDDDPVARPGTDRPNPRQCPRCMRCALYTDVQRFMYEVWPCYPGSTRKETRHEY